MPSRLILTIVILLLALAAILVTRPASAPLSLAPPYPSSPIRAII